jgi:O-acetyl-ADP-ribose deacetylase (regulator of RNase III)
MTERLELIEGDITTIKVDAIVIPSLSSLLKGTGMYKTIHRAAGPELLEACRQLNGCKLGEAKITPGYNLPAKWAIHTACPVWLGGKHGEAEQLAQCYRSCLTLADQHGIRTIAFPPISIGMYRFRVKRAAKIAIAETLAFLDTNTSIEKVFFVVVGELMMQRFSNGMREVMG